MAFHHVALFFTLIFLWHILASASLETSGSYMSPEKSRHLFLYRPLRSTRKISQRAFQDMDLFTARGYGKRGSDCFGGRLCGKRMPEFSGARLYGKRNIDGNQLKCLFVDCEKLDMRNLEYSSRKYSRNDEVVLPD
uniref:Allatotropin n=1 Tax=Colaphellus bowringi TaxID=561076 RepID=A0A7H1K1C2_9CUCU|nr:allatotropin [Colaphellus bowringi]